MRKCPRVVIRPNDGNLDGKDSWSSWFMYPVGWNPGNFRKMVLLESDDSWELGRNIERTFCSFRLIALLFILIASTTTKIPMSEVEIVSPVMKMPPIPQMPPIPESVQQARTSPPAIDSSYSSPPPPPPSTENSSYLEPPVSVDDTESSPPPPPPPPSSSTSEDVPPKVSTVSTSESSSPSTSKESPKSMPPPPAPSTTSIDLPPTNKAQDSSSPPPPPSKPKVSSPPPPPPSKPKVSSSPRPTEQQQQRETSYSSSVTWLNHKERGEDIACWFPLIQWTHGYCPALPLTLPSPVEGESFVIRMSRLLYWFLYNWHPTMILIILICLLFLI